MMRSGGSFRLRPETALNQIDGSFMDEKLRILPILDRWGQGTGATIYLYGSRARDDFHFNSDVDVFIEWPSDYNDKFVTWWTRENGDLFNSISRKLGAKIQVLDPEDKEMQKKIRSGKAVGRFGCAVAIFLPRIKPVR